MADERILVCNRVADMPIPPALATIKVCTAGCLERVWVANSSPADARPVCFQCVKKDPGPHKFEVMTTEQAFDVLRWLGRRGPYRGRP